MSKLRCRLFYQPSKSNLIVAGVAIKSKLRMVKKIVSG